MADRVRKFGWQTRGDIIRDIILGAVLATAVLFVENSARDQVPDALSILRNVVLGAITVLGCRGAETALSGTIERSRFPTTLRVIIYCLGAWIGFFAALIVVNVLIRREPRDFDVTNFHFLYALVATAIIGITMGVIVHANQRRNERLKQHEFAQKELEIARLMQERLLPPATIEQPLYRIEARTHAARIVGGDFYDVIQLTDDAVAVLAADVAGKGIAASLLMASCKAAVPFLASAGSAADVMTALNLRFCEQLHRREFVAMVFARFDPATGAVDIVNAGMPDPFVISPNGRLHTISFRGDRLPLGAMRIAKYEGTRLTLAPGDKLLLFSDGLPEAMANGAPIGYERAETIVREAGNVDEIVRRVTADPSIHVEDDLTLVMLERRAGTAVFGAQVI